MKEDKKTALPKRKILIIEDELTLAKTMAEFLAAEGFGVLNAYDGEKGLELARSEKPDLILLDIIIPKINGYVVLEELKKDTQTNNIPVFLLTNLESMENIQKAFEKGATTYLIKSDYKLEDISLKIKQTLRM